MNRYFKVEGDIIYPDQTLLTWGPFYYHYKDKAIERMSDILNDIINWVNFQDPTLDIKPTNIINMKTQIVFQIKAWKNDNELQNCNGIIEVEPFDFEDKIRII